jgi:hypothetical protein
MVSGIAAGIVVLDVDGNEIAPGAARNRADDSWRFDGARRRYEQAQVAPGSASFV